MTIPRLAARLAALAVAIGAVAGAASAQFSSSVTLVEVYATVTTRSGDVVTDLRAADFAVTDDGVPRDVAAFANGTFPLSVAVAVDRSFSMNGKQLAFVQDAALRFLEALRPDDEAAVIGISSVVETLAPLSTDRAAQRLAVAQLTPWGTTRLHDAVLDALSRIESARGRRALVILSDADDRGSTASAREVIDRVRGTDVLCYPVVVGPRNSSLFTQLAAFTGGRAFWVEDASDLDDAFLAIAGELRQQYLIGFAPVTVAAGAERRFRRVQVRTPGRDTLIRARPGYFAP
ncbi:MAG: VWA domain-containing protein [Acidobacteria bacterium]|nr:VWA domain-containing protein [Acidobacteriota bacterium]